ncbi:MAG TPA: hypothetical protein DDW90_00790 [Cyanobacteria bacterium UBA9971]|nr:hypothetical protein [Cyanobacteria bacterium UBA9971]
MFKKAFTLFLTISFFLLSSGASLAANVEPQKAAIAVEAKKEVVSIPSGTVVPVVLKYPLNSDSLQNSDLISIIIDDDVLIDNHFVFKKGTSGIAYVQKVVHSGQHGRPGYILIKEGKVKDVNKVDHPIQLSIEAKGESKRPSAVFLSVIGVILILIPFGIWRTGTSANVSAAKVMEGFITSPSEIAL